MSLDLFLDAMASEKGLSKNTIEAYRRDIIGWLQFISDGNEKTASEYIDTLSKSGKSKRSIARHISSLRQYFKFLMIEENADTNPFDELDAIKFSRSLPKILSASEVSSLLEEAERDPSPEGRRLWAMIELLYATGMRVSEMISLRMDSVMPIISGNTDESFYITGKGGTERIVFVTKKATEVLKAYLLVRPMFIPACGSVFLFASDSKERHITRQRVGQLLKELALRAGISSEKISPHVLRHAFATHLLENGVDIIFLQALLGHKDISTTQIYTHVDRKRLSEVLNKYHPAA